MKKFKLTATIAAILFGAIAPARADVPTLQQQLQVVQGRRGLAVEGLQGDVTINGNPAQLGDRVGAGDLVVTGDGAIAILRVDSNIGTVEMAENTILEIRTTSGEAGIAPDQVTVFFVPKGRIRASVARFVSAPLRDTSTAAHPQEIAALHWEGLLADEEDSEQSAEESPFRVETPVTVAGVRGTSFGVNVGPDGKTGVSTIEGTVGAISEGEEVRIEPDNFSVVNPGQSPTSPDFTPPLSGLEIFQVTRLNPRTVRVLGQVDPMDLVYIDNREIATDENGKFDAIADLPASRRLGIVVRGPSVRERHYILPVP
ncbi:FecR domain-containing protein [Lyngbya sp. CCY1209]|uniref:FecR family protein n=1 Tax=Lyngbya sp. CCY1209 TaxID=2886103 RepID=UPI002D20124F|nr:FecR domain-containing protein [Lyngbya sp. CCY1209]MEB3883052.1 FecR domain-containing protein [Lyngbya sp. CCY1209]